MSKTRHSATDYRCNWEVRCACRSCLTSRGATFGNFIIWKLNLCWKYLNCILSLNCDGYIYIVWLRASLLQVHYSGVCVFQLISVEIRWELPQDQMSIAYYKIIHSTYVCTYTRSLVQGCIGRGTALSSVCIAVHCTPGVYLHWRYIG